MISKEFEVKLDGGVEARALAVFVQLSCEDKFAKCEIFAECRGRRANAKSIMGMLSLSAAPGEILKITADGQNEEEAVRRLGEYLTA